MCMACVQAGIAGMAAAWFGCAWMKCKWCLRRAHCGKDCKCPCHKKRSTKIL
jgi:hypothetical protein